MLPKYTTFDGMLDNAPKGGIGRKTPVDASIKNRKDEEMERAARFCEKI
jgi:hypothetical protein